MVFCIRREVVRKDSAFSEKREVNAMEKINKKTILYTIGVVVLLVIAYYSRAFHTQVDDPILKMLLVMTRSVIQISLVIAWCSSVRTRIINKQVRHYLIAVGILLLQEMPPVCTYILSYLAFYSFQPFRYGQ